MKLFLVSFCRSGLWSGSDLGTKNSIIMQVKLVTLLLLIGCLQVSARGYGQRVTLQVKDATLKEVFQSIKHQTGYFFVYDLEMIKDAKSVSMNVRNIPLEKALQLCFKGQSLGYTMVDKTIVVKAAPVKYPAVKPVDTSIQIEGKVTNKSKASLPGVSVSVKGTQTGTITDSKGHYSLQIPDLQDTLVFSYVGYNREEVAINGRRQIDVVMKTSISSLNQLVVVGYGTQKKSDLTGAIASMGVDSLTKGVVTSVSDLLSNGNLPGVNVVRNSAAPGGGISINIRGASSINAGTAPLYVVDGLPISSSPLITGSGVHFPGSRTKENILNSINPNDIKSISVLKGPSATAIYGARGSNGVILITTKHGTEGPMRVEYNSYAGIQRIAHKLEVLNAQQYKSILNDIIDAGGGDPSDKITTIANDGRGTDWQEAIFNNNAFVQNQQISFSGGSNTTTYLISLNYLDQYGIIKNNRLNRYGARINVTSKLSDKFDVGINLSTAFNRNHKPPIQSFGVNLDNGPLYAAYNADPTLPIKDQEGNYTPMATYITVINPVAMVNGESSLIRTYRTFGNIYAQYFILPQLSVKLNIGGDILNQDKNVYVSRLAYTGKAQNGIATIFHGKQSNYLFGGVIKYEKSFQDQTLKITGGVSTQQFDQYNINMSANGFPSDETKTYNIGLGDPSNFAVYSQKQMHRLLSYFGRVNYSLFDKYLITASLRIDGSSRFGPNDKFGYFPSAAFAWRIKEEPFLRDVSFISDLKLRIGGGETGNNAIGNYAYISTYARGPKVIMNGQEVSTTEPSRLANPDLKWETSRAINAGLDYGFFDNRLTGSLNYYYKETYDMLVQLPVPTSSGFTTRLTNIGSMINKGLEFALSSQNVVAPKFKWESDISFSTVQNRVKDLGGIQSIISGGAGFSGNVFITEPGKPLNSFYGYKIVGVWQKDDKYEETKMPVQPGDLKYRDVNGDSIINADDRVILGNSFPDFTWSFGNTFNYKNIQLYINFRGVEGINMLNANMIDSYFPINLRRNKFAEPYLNRWTPSNPSNKYPSFVHPLSQGNKAVNSYTVEDASFIRLQSARLSYSLSHFSNVIRSATIYVTGENLLTITKYDGVDPSVNPNGSANKRIDYNAYPMARTFLLGIKLDF